MNYVSSKRDTAPASINMTLAAEGARLAEAVVLPTISELVHLAVTQTDFAGDLADDGTLEDVVANSIDAAADLWSDGHGYTPVPLSLIQWARCALLLEAEAMLRDREAQAEAEAELADDIEAGNRDRDGNVIPWERYP